MNRTRVEPHNLDLRKRLGQFFTGQQLALVLAALAEAGRAKSIVDPMCGSGDMLLACAQLSAEERVFAGIEIDTQLAETCERRCEGRGVRCNVVCGNSFSRDAWEGLPPDWDLVITNPPYVRYQTGSQVAGVGFEIPSAQSIREMLVDQLSSMAHLSPSARRIFVQCAEDYSGLADLAVPSWLLCASRVSEGGRLAMVVPDTWLSRDYAVPVLYVLRRLFEVQYVVCDRDVNWFDDALVRTTLVVAQRVDVKSNAFVAAGHLRVNLRAETADARSLVGRAFPENGQPEMAFARWAQQAHSAKSTCASPISASWSDETDMVRRLMFARNRYPWLAQEDCADEGQTSAPELLLRALGTGPENLIGLAEMGWKVGQALRTGANDFFYLHEHPDGSLSSCLLPGERLVLPAGVARPCVRRQSDLPADGSRVVAGTQSRVLILDGWALAEDMATAAGPAPWQPMTGDLARLVQKASETTYSRGGVRVPLHSLSAVRTNAHRYSVRRPECAARFWYQLPILMPRHYPALFMARVNAAHAGAYLNPQCRFVVDANFSSFWPVSSDAIPQEAMLAILTSSWVRCYLEASATVLGGGALKVEATHLRRLLVPRIDRRAADELFRCGRDLIANGPAEKTISRIDALVLGSLEPSPAPGATSAVAQLSEQLARARLVGQTR